ncbi:hypothetical protein J6590_023617 [Homalodisca vitripennis]|nr:hypothetical protein J6590_023617 [Homalodisca vitripennis]
MWKRSEKDKTYSTNFLWELRSRDGNFRVRSFGRHRVAASRRTSLWQRPTLALAEIAVQRTHTSTRLAI